MTLLVAACTSPVQSAYSDQVAERLAREIRKLRKSFNAAAGGYAVDLAQSLSLVSAQNAWADKGHLLNLVASIKSDDWESAMQLDDRGRIFYFRVFLEADGAALGYLCRYVLDRGSLPANDDSWNSVARDMFTEAYKQYAQLVTRIDERVELRRQLKRLDETGYSGKSGAHKMFVHAQTLYRIGLLAREDTGNGRIYKVPAQNGVDRIKAFVEEVGDAVSLERVIAGKRFMEVAAAALDIHEASHTEDEWSDMNVIDLILPFYERVMSTGVPLCSLGTLVEAVQIDWLQGRGVVIPYDRILEALTSAQRRDPRSIRFHVDRRGRPAYLKLDLTRKAAG